MRTKVYKAKRHRRGLRLGRLLALIAVTLAVVAYILIGINSYGSGGPANSPQVSAPARADSPVGLDSLIPKLPSSSGPATSPKTNVLLTEPPGDSPEVQQQYQISYESQVDDYTLMQECDANLHNWYAEQAADAQKQRDRESLTNRMRAYCINRGFRQDIIDRIPTMIDLGYQTANDPRICIVTCHLESSGGRGANNLFGVLKWRGCSPDVDYQINYYFQQITSYGLNGDVWQIAFMWYDSSDPGGKATRYANGVLADVQAI